MPADRPLADGGAPRRLPALILTLLVLAACSVPDPSVTSPSEPTPLASSASSTDEHSASNTADICGRTDPGTRSGEVLVYFTCGTSPIAAPFPVVRSASGSSTNELLASALTELLAGPTADEQERGWRSWFSDATADMLVSATLADGLATVDFADFSQLIPNASTSAGRRQLLAELQSTVFQFPEISRLELRFNGDCLAFWSWLGALRCELLQRAPE